MDDLPLTSETLIGKVRDPGDEEAWRRFAALYRPVVMRMGLRRGLQEADAEDVAQRVMVAVSRAISRFEIGPDRPPFRVWLGRIATNAILNALTRAPRDRGAGDTDIAMLLSEIPAGNEEGQKEILREAQTEAFRWAAAEIKSEFSSSVWLLFWETMVEGREVEETAKRHGRSPGSVYMARFRVMKRLREKIHEVWNPESGV